MKLNVAFGKDTVCPYAEMLATILTPVRCRFLVGSGRDDIMCGNERNNTIRGDDGDDTIFGREGKDKLFGQGDDDLLYGNDGDDELDGGECADMAVYVKATTEEDTEFFYVDLEEGLSEVKTAADRASVTDAERGEECEILEDLIDVENLWGSAQPDVLLGDSGNNLIGGYAGGDYLDGRGGTNTVSYAMSTTGVTFRLAPTGNDAGTENGNAAGDTLKGFENIKGSAHADSLSGDANNNAIWGDDGPIRY